jgi:hypothetical protein
MIDHSETRHSGRGRGRLQTDHRSLPFESDGSGTSAWYEGNLEMDWRPQSWASVRENKHSAGTDVSGDAFALALGLAVNLPAHTDWQF